MDDSFFSTLKFRAVVARKIGAQEFAIVGQGEAELRSWVDGDQASAELEIEHVATRCPVLGEKVKVVSRYVQSLSVVRKSKPDEGPSHVGELEGGLFASYIHQVPVRLSLGGHA